MFLADLDRVRRNRFFYARLIGYAGGIHPTFTHTSQPVSYKHVIRLLRNRLVLSREIGLDLDMRRRMTKAPRIHQDFYEILMKFPVR